MKSNEQKGTEERRAVNKYNAESLVKSVEVVVVVALWPSFNSKLRLGLHLHLQKEC